jgi:magnesium-transporting ATPase (P-type)
VSTNGGRPAADTRSAIADGSWMLWAVVGLVSIWLAVLVISLFSPDLVSGTQQEHLPLAAMTTWLWGLFATALFLWTMSRLRGKAERRPIWTGVTLAVAGIWLIATILSLTIPVFETGTDPTQLPFGALFAPIAAAMLTGFVGVVAGMFARPPEPG